MARINDIIAYPTEVPVDTDIVIGSKGSGGDTKNFEMSAIKTYVNSEAGVTSVTSANTAITVATGTTTPVLTSTAYTGTTNIGHVPTGGDSLKYLKGDGTWGTPLVTSSILYATGGTQNIEELTTADITFSDVNNTDVEIGITGEITFQNAGLYIVEFFGNFKLSSGVLSEVMFQPFLDASAKYNSAYIQLPITPDIFRPFTRTDVFQVTANQVLTYKAGHTTGSNAQLRGAGSSVGSITQTSPATSVTVSRIKI